MPMPTTATLYMGLRIMSKHRELLGYAVEFMIKEFPEPQFRIRDNGCDWLFEKKDGTRIAGLHFRDYDPSQNVFQTSYPNHVLPGQEYVVLVDITDGGDMAACVITALMLDGKDKESVEKYVKEKMYLKLPKYKP
jgi:hypothetical protein